MTTLCASYGVSRETGYKWQSRYAAGGIEALVDLSRARHSQPTAVSAEVAAKALALRKRWPRWGPKKLRAVLMRDWPELVCPAASTLGDLLKRNGLVTGRRVRRDNQREKMRQSR